MLQMFHAHSTCNRAECQVLEIHTPEQTHLRGTEILLNGTEHRATIDGVCGSTVEAKPAFISAF